MGGSLKNPNPRLEAGEYHAYAERLLPALRAAAPGARIEMVPAYASKASFGDLDLVVDFGAGTEAEAARAAVVGVLHPEQTAQRRDVTSMTVPASVG